MYLTCNSCSLTAHISAWKRLGKFYFICPECNTIKNCEILFNENLQKEKENWKKHDVV
jgi:hypothetical protein